MDATQTKYPEAGGLIVRRKFGEGIMIGNVLVIVEFRGETQCSLRCIGPRDTSISRVDDPGQILDRLNREQPTTPRR